MTDKNGSDNNIYRFPSGAGARKVPARDGAAGKATDGDRPKARNESTDRRSRRHSRLTKTAAGLALIVGTGGSVASLAGADNLSPARSGATGVTAARVVDITQLGSARKAGTTPAAPKPSPSGAMNRRSPKRPEPDDPGDGGPSAA